MSANTPDAPTREQLKARIEELEARLGESEETLRAIREGEVDAVVVSGSGGERVYSLTESESIYRLMVETMAEVGLAVSPEGIILFANGCAGRLLQRPLEQIVGQPIRAFVHARDHSRLSALLEASADCAVDGRITLEASDGRTVPVYMWANQLDRSDGATICMTGVDLTQMEASKEIIGHLEEQRAALQKSEQRLALATSATRIGMFEWDLNAGTLLWTQATKAILGYAPAGATTTGTTTTTATTTEHDYREWEDRVHPDDLPGLMSNVRRHMLNRTPVEEPYRVIWPDGGVHWVETRAIFLYDTDGKAVRMTGVVVDITERKQAEEDLANAHRQLQNIIDNTPAMVYACDLEARFVMVNVALAALFKTTPLQILGKRRHEFMPQADADAHEANDREVIAAGRAVQLEEHSELPGGSITWLSTKFPLRDAQGRIYAVAGIVTDITERKRAEKALQQLNESLEERVAEQTAEVRRRADQLRALAVELSQAEQRERKRLSQILHDHIQQLIVAARMQIDWFEREKDPERRRTAANGVRGILGEALEASRSLAVELSPPALHQSGLIGGLNWLAARMMERNQFHVHFRADNKAEPESEDTRFLLFECARELLLNAMKHSGVSEAEVTLLRAGADRIRLVVHDAGKGFSAEKIAQLPAMQASFGLFSVQQRLAHIGGEIEITTAPGKGTTIALSLPAPEGGRHAVEPSADARRPSKPDVRVSSSVRRVLIVDDHKIMREGLAGIMQFEPDIEVVGQAADGPTAIQMVEALQPDVILMDVTLGEMDGVEATRRIHTLQPGVKIIGLSMHTGKDVAVAMREAGAVAYMTKGGPSEDLLAAIRAVCR